MARTAWCRSRNSVPGRSAGVPAGLLSPGSAGPATAAIRLVMPGATGRRGGRRYCLRLLQFFFQKLLAIKLRIIAAGLQQLVMSAALGDAAAFQHNNLVRVANSGNAMR